MYSFYRYKFCGSLPNHLDDKDTLDDDRRDNNNISSDNVGGNFGTLPHKKRSLGVHFSDSGPTGTLDLVKHRSQDSLDENDPWRYVIIKNKNYVKTIQVILQRNVSSHITVKRLTCSLC